MKSLTAALARLFRTHEMPGPFEPGAEIELDGASAVARTEAALGSVPAGDPAAALGLALTGARATCVIGGADAEASVAAVRTAAGRHAPFVAHLFARASEAHALARGTGHEGLHGLADAGAFVLVAQSVRDAAYLTLVARCVAERALVPGIVVLDEEEIARSVQTTALPESGLVEDLAGRPDDVVPCPTLAQRSLFGEVRRRVPKWIDREQPALLGATVGPEAWALGAAGRRPWVLGRVPLLLQEEFDRLGDRTGIRFDSAPAVGMDGAETVIVATGSLVETAKRVTAEIRNGGGARVGVLGVRTLRPFPEGALGEVLKDARRVLVLERTDAPLAGEPPLTREVRAALAKLPAARRSRSPHVVTVIAGAGGLPVRDEDLRSVCLAPPEEPDRLVYRGVAGRDDDPDHPKRQALHDRLARDYPEIRSLGRRGERARKEPAAGEPAVPPRVRGLGRTDVDWSSLPRFWDQVGVLYHEARVEELSPDPQLSLGVVPKLSASFRDRSRETGGWPSFDPALCTGCGACWTLCPDGAITVSALSVRELLDAGLEGARRRGRAPEVLRSVLAPLAGKAEARVRAESPSTLADALRPALDEVLAKSKPDAERRAGIVAAFEAVLEEIGGLPVARTEALFDDAAKGKGALLSLSVDPAACQACGVCVEACEPGALGAAEYSEERRVRDVELRDRLAEMPAPSTETLERIRDADPGPAGALLIGAEGRSAMVGGDPSEPASGPRLALRLVLAAAVAHLAPRRDALLAELDELRTSFADEIRHGMLDAVPTDDLDAIAKGLRVLGGPDVDVADLVKRLEDACESDRVDAERLAALVEAAKDVANLRDARARVGAPPAPPAMVLAGESLAGMATFPDNPFAGPVVVASGAEAARITLGISRGETREVAAGVGVVRRARATLRQPLAPGTPAPEWSELDETERAWAPPVLLVLDAATWGRQELAAVDALLESSRPAVVCILADEPPRPSPALPWLTRGGPFVLQSSIAFPDHLAAGLAAAFANPGPAFVHVLAPSPSAAGVAPERLLELARRPVEERAFPLFRRDGDGLHLDGNPETASGEPRADDLAVWETLTELAGVGGPRVEHAREEGREAERDAARSEWEPRVEAAVRSERGEMERRLTHRLMELAGWSDESAS